MRTVTVAAVCCFLLPYFSCHAQFGGTKPSSEVPSAAPDYSQAGAWVCRPGSESVCTTGLDAVAVYPDGRKVPQPFTPAANPAVDCFYVYPTVSLEQRDYTDLTATPEVQEVVKAQAGRLSSRCRVFAPIYRQATLRHLRERLSGHSAEDSDVPSQDLAAAWAYYLAHDNHGRGIIIVAHSQGTILLQELIAKSIDGAPVQKLLVSAFLAGDPSLAVPPGKLLGGTFQHIPLCTSASSLGCVYVWGSYLDGNVSDKPVFGRARADGMVSACVNPVAPGGGTGTLKFYHAKSRDAEPGDPPYVEVLDQIAGTCETLAGGNEFNIHVLPGPNAAVYQAMLKRVESRPGWGVHGRDIALVQGNILDVMDVEIAAWKKTHR